MASSENDRFNNLLTFSLDTPSASGDDSIQELLSGKYDAEADIENSSTNRAEENAFL